MADLTIDVNRIEHIRSRVLESQAVLTECLTSIISCLASAVDAVTATDAVQATCARRNINRFQNQYLGNQLAVLAQDAAMNAKEFTETDRTLANTPASATEETVR